MTPAWSLSVLLLGFAFGIPVPSLNDTRQQDQTIDNLLQRDNEVDNSTGYESSVQVNDTLGNLTQHFQTNDTRNDTDRAPFMIILPMPNMEDSPQITLQGPGCFLSTCATAQLSSSLQTGDEKAGDATRDPFGMGK